MLLDTPEKTAPAHPASAQVCFYRLLQGLTAAVALFVDVVVVEAARAGAALAVAEARVAHGTCSQCTTHQIAVSAAETWNNVQIIHPITASHACCNWQQSGAFCVATVRIAKFHTASFGATCLFHKG
jgi:anti-sigma factor RsiW